MASKFAHFQYHDPTLVQIPTNVKFNNVDGLSTSSKLIVQTSRTPAGHYQEWKKFELPDGTSIANPRLRWSTKYLPAAGSPGRATSPKSQTSGTAAKFVLDIIYLSKSGDYRFAMRANRAAACAVTTDEESFLLLYLTDVCEWDAPPGGNYKNHKYKPTNWLKLPQTLKLFAKSPDDFLKLKFETVALCISQNIMIWCPKLREAFVKTMKEPSMQQALILAEKEKEYFNDTRKRSSLLDKLAARIPKVKPDEECQNPFTMEDAGPSLVKSPLQTSPKTISHIDRRKSLQIPFGQSYKRHTFATSPSVDSPETEISPNSPASRKQSKEEDIFIRNASSSPSHSHGGNGMTPDEVDLLFEHRISTTEIGKRVAPASPPLSPSSDRPNKRLSRWGPDLNIGFSDDEQKGVSLGEDIELPRSSPPLRLRTKIQRPTSYPPATELSTPTPLSPEEKRKSFGDQLKAVTAAAYVRVQPDAVRIEPRPDYVYLPNGQDLNVEFKRKLVFGEAVVAQWAKEYDMRRGLLTPINLDRITALDREPCEEKFYDAKEQ
ncbi:hypothetical protein TWF694_009245 [Orbilia ellipsospora]|uniref:Uncharacterized protein n=1 Tax=Orbilia ellipsospora TaxID=2528407 RepID=A0AAV9XET3_9PEZI